MPVVQCIMQSYILTASIIMITCTMYRNTHSHLIWQTDCMLESAGTLNTQTIRHRLLKFLMSTTRLYNDTMNQDPRFKLDYFTVWIQHAICLINVSIFSAPNVLLVSSKTLRHFVITSSTVHRTTCPSTRQVICRLGIQRKDNKWHLKLNKQINK